MKHNLKYVISLVFMLMLTQSTWADPTVTIIKKVNGSPAAATTTSPGEVSQAIADGKCTLTVTPEQGYYVTKDFITVYSVVTGNDLDNNPIEVSNKGENTDPTDVTTYEFTMPGDGSDAEVTVDFHSITTYNLYIGETQVTELNAADVLGNGMVAFTVSKTEAPVYTLTLNGAELTVPVKVGLDNLTIDIQGTNSITTTETCLQKMDNTNLSLTFKSTSNPVGSLTLTTNGQESEVSEIGEGEITISKELAPILPHSGNPGGYSSNMYWFTDDLKEARFVPSYGVKVGDVYVFAGNETDVLYDKTETKDPSVSFDKNSNTLTLNNASDISNISTSLSTLNINLVGTNSLFRGSNGSIFESSSDEAITINLKSTGTTKGSLKMETQSNSGAQLKGDNVTLTAESPLVLLSGDLTTNKGTLVYGVNYDLWISDTRVTSANASNIFGDGKVSYSPSTSILTLNGASIPAIFSNHALTIQLLGSNIIDANNKGAIYYQGDDSDIQLNFTTDESTPGQLLITNTPQEGGVVNGFAVNYANGLGFTWEGSAFAIATLPSMSPEGGIYWTDQEFTISGNDGATLGYTDGVETYTEYTEPFRLNVGSQTLAPYSLVTDGTNTVHVRPAEGQIYYIHNKPGFSIAAGTYDEAQNITLTDLPATLPEGDDAYPQVWYFLGDDDNDDSNDVRITSATQKIEVSESTKVSVYILEGDSSKKKKSEVVEAEYVIHQNPNLQFVQGEDPVEVVDWTIGGTDNPALPTLMNTSEVAVTYESSNPDVATVAADGTVTPVGVGETTITATSAQTDVYTAGSASYPLYVYKDLSHSSITIEVAEATYTGEELEPAVTVKDGETSIADFVSVAYANNTNAASSSDETAPTVTVTAIVPGAESGLEINWYKGSAQKTFTIAAANITELYEISLEETSYVYDGTEQEPAVAFMMDNEPEELSDDDYEVAYSNNVNVGSADAETGAPTVTVTGKGNYSGSKTLTFSITAMSLEEATVTVDATQTYTYSGTEITPNVTVSLYLNDELTTLTADDYTVKYANNVNAALASDNLAPTVTVTGKGNYTGSASANFTIGKATPTITTAPKANTLTYTGESQELITAGVASAGTLVYSKTINGRFTAEIPEETNAGTYTVYYKVDGNDNYNGIEASETNKVSVTINPATITGVTLTESALVYNGESQTVEIATVTAGTLVLTNENTDFAKVFDISGNSATERGTHTVTITAKENSNFTGSATADFSIKYTTASLYWFEFAAGQTFGTFYYPEENLELPETIKAYIISGVSGNSVTLTDLNYIPMGVPVLVEKIKGTATRPEANPETTDNMLKYASENASLNRSAGTLYVLYNGMFVRATNNTVAAQNVYLQVPVSTPNSARTLSIKGGDGTTAIESVNRIESSDTDRWYDMQGRRIERPTKTGIYLNNGKKVVIK